MRPCHDRFSTQFWCFSSGVFAYPESLGAQLENGQKTANNWTKNGFEIGSQKFAAIIALRKALHATRNNTNNAVCISAARPPTHSPPRRWAAGGARPSGPSPAPRQHPLAAARHGVRAAGRREEAAREAAVARREAVWRTVRRMLGDHAVGHGLTNMVERPLLQCERRLGLATLCCLPAPKRDRALEVAHGRRDEAAAATTTTTTTTISSVIIFCLCFLYRPLITFFSSGTRDDIIIIVGNERKRRRRQQ